MALQGQCKMYMHWLFLTWFLFQLVLAPAVEAISTLYPRNGTALELNDYTFAYGARQDFSPMENVTLFVYDGDQPCPNCLDACSPPTQVQLEFFVERAKVLYQQKGPKQTFASLGIAFESPRCSMHMAVRHVLDVDNAVRPYGRVVGAMHFLGTFHGKQALDMDPRFAFDPNLLRNRNNKHIALNRVHGEDPDRVIIKGFECGNSDDVPGTVDGPGLERVDYECNISHDAKLGVMATVKFKQSQWKTLYLSTGYTVYLSLAMVVYTLLFAACIRYSCRGWTCRGSCIQLSDSQETNHTTASVRYLQMRELCCLLVISVLRTLDSLLVLFRDVLGIWVPEIVPQLLWMWEYALALVAAWILLDYFNTVLHMRQFGQSKRQTFVGKPLIIFVTVTILLFLTLSVSSVIFVYQITSYFPFFRILATGLLALGALATSTFLIHHGFTILRHLTSGKSQRYTNDTVELEPSSVSKTSEFSLVSKDSFHKALSKLSINRNNSVTSTNSINKSNSITSVHSVVKSSSSMNSVNKPNSVLRNNSVTSVNSVNKSSSVLRNNSITTLSATNRETSRPKRGRRETRRLLPLTRLVLGCAIAMLIGTVVTIVSSVTNTLSDPANTEIVLFVLLGMELMFSLLVAYTVTPLNPLLRRRSKHNKALVVAGNTAEAETLLTPKSSFRTGKGNSEFEVKGMNHRATAIEEGDEGSIGELEVVTDAWLTEYVEGSKQHQTSESSEQYSDEVVDYSSHQLVVDDVSPEDSALLPMSRVYGLSL